MSKIIDWSAALGRGLLYLYMRVAFRPKVIYLSEESRQAIRNGGNVIISNHVGHNDGQMFYMVFHRSALTIAKDWADKGILKWVTTGGRFIPVDRFGMDISWVRTAGDSIKNHNNVIIFPEGHTSKGDMDEFKSGFVMVSVMTGARIIPVYNDGQYHKVFGRRLRLYVGAPVEISSDGKGLRADYLTAEANRFRDIIEKMKEDHKR